MAGASSRPLSPHLSIWKWGPHMLVSILHRVSGDGMAIVGGVLFTWWLVAAASGPAAYADFLYYAVAAAPGDPIGIAINWIALVVGVGLTWAFFEHALSGIRHFVLDIGAGYALKTNRTWSIVIVALAPVLTAATWAGFILGKL